MGLTLQSICRGMLALLLQASPDDEPPPAGGIRTVFAYRMKGELFASTLEESEGYCGRVWSQNITKLSDPPKWFGIYLSVEGGSHRPYFSNGAFWAKFGRNVHRVPVEELFLYCDLNEAKLEAIRTKYPNTRANDWSFQYWPIKPVYDRPFHQPRGFGLARGFLFQDKRFDGFPIGDDQFRVFCPDEAGERIDVYDGMGKWDHENQKWRLKWDEKPRDVIRPGFKAPFWWNEHRKDYEYEQGSPKRDFYAFRSGDTYIFFTDTHKLFVAPKGEGKERKLHPVAMPKSRIKKTIFFTDMEQDKTFLLGVDERAGLVHFAELKEQPRFQSVRLKDLNAPDVVEPVRSARQAVQALSEAKLITLETKK